MAQLITKANILLEWDNGKKVSLGTITTETSENGNRVYGLKRLSQRIGWEFVRAGMRFIFGGGQKWRISGEERETI